MNCFERLGERVMSRTFERQVNELHIRAAILNRCTESSRPQTVSGIAASGVGAARPLQVGLRNNASTSTHKPLLFHAICL